MNPDLQRIIVQCKSGNRASQKKLYFLTIDRIKKVLARYCQDLNDSQDIVQSTYLKIFEKINQFDPGKGEFESWTNRILINEFLQLQRKRKKILYFDDHVIDISEAEDFNWSRFTLVEVQHVIGKLNKSHAVLLNLFFFEQFNYKELSKVLNIRESSVRGNITRAKQAFAAEWKRINHITIKQYESHK